MYCVLADGRTNYSTKFGIAESGYKQYKSIHLYQDDTEFEDNENKVTINFIVYFVIKCVKYY